MVVLAFVTIPDFGNVMVADKEFLTFLRPPSNPTYSSFSIDFIIAMASTRNSTVH
jgi:hypothetical protein